MFDLLKKYCIQEVPFTETELKLIDKYFEEKKFKKKEILLQDTEVCAFIGFIAKGSIRHFHIKDGVEKTCDISLDHAWVTDFQSFTYGTISKMNFQALDDTTLYLINKNNLYILYQECIKFETFGRLMAEKIALKATEIAMSLSEKPEERLNKLLRKQPEIFQRVPQKYIANLLGVSPESLSRIQKRIYNKSKS